MLNADALRNELESMRAQTDGSYNVNFFCHSAPEPDAGREANWRVALSPSYRVSCNKKHWNKKGAH